MSRFLNRWFDGDIRLLAQSLEAAAMLSGVATPMWHWADPESANDEVTSERVLDQN